jgi:hypothetical protein
VERVQQALKPYDGVIGEAATSHCSNFYQMAATNTLLMDGGDVGLRFLKTYERSAH